MLILFAVSYEDCARPMSYSPLDAHDEDELGLSRDVGGVVLLGNTGEADLLALRIAVLLNVLLSTLEDHAALLLVGLENLSANQALNEARAEIKFSYFEWHIRPERRLTFNSIDLMSS